MGGEGSDDKCQYMSVEWMNIRILREHGAHRCWDRIFYTMVCSFHGSASNMCHGRDSTTTLSASLEKKKKNSFPILPRDKLNKWMIPNIIQSDPNWCIWH